MGRKVKNGDYAKPLFTRIYKKHRRMLTELVQTFPLKKLKYPAKGGPTEVPVSDSEVVQVAIEDLHKKRCHE